MLKRVQHDNFVVILASKSMDTNKFFQSKVFIVIILGIGALVILLFGFKVGEIVGAKKADFSCRWSDNYQRNFGGPRGGFPGGFGDQDFIEANGTFGQIIKVDGSTLIVKGRNDIEKVILVKDATTIKRLQDTIKLSDLKADDSVVVIGQANDLGQIEAKLIRVMPASSKDMTRQMPLPGGPRLR